MAVAVADLLKRAAYVLNDDNHVRWTETELIDWINDAAAEIVIHRPAARAVTATINLDAGTRQAITGRATQLMDVVRNITADDKPGRGVSRVSRTLLDDSDPDWYAGREKDAVKHYTFDDRNPTEFYVYPPVKAGTKVEALYAELPPKVASNSDSLDLDEEYRGPVLSYVLYRALAKDSEFANGNVAAAHWQAFAGAVGIRNQAGVAVGPKGELNEES